MQLMTNFISFTRPILLLGAVSVFKKIWSVSAVRITATADWDNTNEFFDEAHFKTV